MHLLDRILKTVSYQMMPAPRPLLLLVCGTCTYAKKQFGY